MAAKGREQGRPVLAEGRRCAASEVRSEPGADEVVSTTSSIWFGFECVIPSVYEVKWALAMDMLRWDDCDQTRLASAVEENIWSLWKNFALGEDSAFHDLYGARCLETPIKSHPYNFVMNFVGGKDFSGQIDKVFEHFGKRDTPFIWLMTSSSRPAHLSEHLQKRGMELAEVMPAMATRLDHIDTSQIATSSDIQITEAGSEDADDLLNFVSYRWDVPEQYRDLAFDMYRRFEVGQRRSPIRAWLARRNGLVIGKAILHIGSGVAGIHVVVVRPEARGAGLGRTLTLLALKAAQEAGYEVTALASSPMAERWYASIGFEKVGELPLYTPKGEFQF
jgi:N-acetylglutamate synthase-like GNAT family acetyltransferase